MPPWRRGRGPRPSTTSAATCCGGGTSRTGTTTTPPTSPRCSRRSTRCARWAGVDGTHRSVAALATWFHDAVYAVEPAAANEAESASLAARQLGRLGVDPELTARVVAVVLDTASHALSADALADPARVVVHDADLWVLAAPVARFDEYCAQVREEYAHVPVALYASARAEVLRPFLVRDHVYRTEHARAEWEPSARENLARELTRLAA